jgi:glycosyltransferase involved in cell wall biosynthesis
MIIKPGTTVSSTPDRSGENVVSFSILTPSYGYAEFIGDAIESVRHQDAAGSVEHIIIDGGSTDGTVDILRSYPDVIWNSEPDDGQSDALNKGFARSAGEIVGWLNADEFYLQGVLSRVQRVFERDDVDVVYGDSMFVDRAGKFLRLVPQHRFNERVLRHYGCFIPSCAVFFRQSVLPDVPWNRQLATIMDWDLYLDLARQQARFGYLPEALGAFRVHAAQVTAEPLAKTAPERLQVRRTHGMTNRLGPREAAAMAARFQHRTLKLFGGAYGRQIRARSFAGEDLRWWDRQASDC